MTVTFSTDRVTEQRADLSGVRTVALRGSRARGIERPDSDRYVATRFAVNRSLMSIDMHVSRVIRILRSHALQVVVAREFGVGEEVISLARRRGKRNLHVAVAFGNVERRSCGN
jgi:predicted nucleotidyltransferase